MGAKSLRFNSLNIIYKEGDLVRDAYVVGDGIVHIKKKVCEGKGGYKVVEQLTKGCVFGLTELAKRTDMAESPF
jgi:hypothetical protein